MSARTFPIEPASSSAVAMLAAISIFVAALGVCSGAVLADLPFATWAALVPCMAISALFAWFALAQARSSVVINGRSLELHLPLYGRRLSTDDIVEDSLTAVTLPRDDAFALSWRTNGLAVPGYQLGWFKTRSMGRALAAITGKELVSWQTKQGYRVLLSVRDRDGFMRELRAAR